MVCCASPGAQHLSGSRTGTHPVAHGEHSVHEHARDSGRRLLQILTGGTVDDRLSVEHQVCRDTKAARK